MKVIPAIDILDGRAVSLYQGDFERKEFEADNPLELAENFMEHGADELHMVDLNGAREGEPENVDLIMDIIENLSGADIQVGGGIRSLSTARKYLQGGARAVVVGTAAVKNPHFMGEMIQEFSPESVIASLDAREGELALSGWEEESGIGVNTHLSRLIDQGVARFIYTDINRDGTLRGPDISALKRLGRHEIEITASGGISSHREIEELEKNGIDRAIIGTAIYKGELDLEELWGKENAD